MTSPPAGCRAGQRRRQQQQQRGSSPACALERGEHTADGQSSPWGQ